MSLELLWSSGLRLVSVGLLLFPSLDPSTVISSSPVDDVYVNHFNSFVEVAVEIDTVLHIQRKNTLIFIYCVHTYIHNPADLPTYLHLI